MTKNNLSEKKIQSFAHSSDIYHRGQDYFKRKQVYNLEFDAEEQCITAQVIGNYGNYEVEVHLGKTIEADCNCPYDGYPCKHAIAVLLQYLNQQNQYTTTAQQRVTTKTKVNQRLQALNKDELLKILEAASKKYPALAEDLRIQLAQDDSEAIQAFTQKVRQAIPAVESHHYDVYEIQKKLKQILKTLKECSAKIQLEIHWLIATKLLADLDEYGIDDEELEEIVIECLNKVAFLLDQHPALQERKQTILETLMVYYSSGNNGLVDHLYDLALEVSNTDVDYRFMIAKLESKAKNMAYASFYNREIAALYTRLGDDQGTQKALESQLTYGMDYWALAQFWLKKQNNAKALQVIQTGVEKGEGRKDELYTYLQQHYIKAQAFEELLKLFKHWAADHHHEDSETYKTNVIYRGLLKHYQAQNNTLGLKKLLEIRLNGQSLDLGLYQDAQALLTEQDFRAFENKFVTKLEKSAGKPGFGVSDEEEHLAEFYVFKKEYDQLFAFVKKRPLLLEKHETSLLPLHPTIYLTHYLRRVDECLQARTKDSYKKAVGYLKRLKKIYQIVHGNATAWQTYFQTLKADNKRLRLFQEELAKTKLN